jgi:hypothetical protein
LLVCDLGNRGAGYQQDAKEVRDRGGVDKPRVPRERVVERRRERQEAERLPDGQKIGAGGGVGDVGEYRVTGKPEEQAEGHHPDLFGREAEPQGAEYVPVVPVKFGHLEAPFFVNKVRPYLNSFMKAAKTRKSSTTRPHSNQRMGWRYRRSGKKRRLN